MTNFPNNCKDDIFLRLVQDAEFFASTEQFFDKVKDLERRIQSLPPNEERLNIELAVLSLKFQRTGTELDSRTAREQLDRIKTYISTYPQVAPKFKFVEGQYYFGVEHNYLAAIEILEDLLTSIKRSEHFFLHALASRTLSATLMMLGDISKAEEMILDTVVTFKWFESELLYAYSLNNLGVLKKKICLYFESEKCLKKSLKLFKRIGAIEGEANCLINLGNIKKKFGDWDDAEYYYENAIALSKKVYSDIIYPSMQETNLACLYLQRRDFIKAESILNGLKEVFFHRNFPKHQSLILEFLGEIYYETGKLDKSQNCLDKAEEITEQSAPQSDVMTEIKRRKAHLYFLKGEFDRAKIEALECIQLCRKNGDKLELGAALRVLGNSYAALKESRKAVSAYEAGINILKSIHECYELMRSCISYSRYLVEDNKGEAELYLLEAKQLCTKLKLDHFMCQIMLLMGRQAMNAGDYTDARNYLNNTEALSTNLQECDKRTIKPSIEHFYEELESRILRISMNSAEKLKALGRIYEDARFPLEEARPEIALKVARNAGAESLFLAKKDKKSYVVPLAYNMSKTTAREIAKAVDQRNNSSKIRNNTDPIIQPLEENRVVACIPSLSEPGYDLYAVINGLKDVTPQQLEFLFASHEVLERVAIEYSSKSTSRSTSTFIETGSNRLSHPGGVFKDILTIDSELIKIIHLSMRASETNTPILLEGETGVGKELFARGIHASSPRRNNEIVIINAGGMPVNLLESQLFGHVKGAFTDAVMDRVGLVEEASGGSIFFDEIGEMKEELQVKLLRLLENGEFRRLGENKLRHANVRIISATNKNMPELVEKGLFRKDLYYRLSAVRFHIPPLRSRPRDIELLVRHFLRNILNSMHQFDRPIGIDMKALEAFELYDWPGNVRELQNEILRLVSLIGQGEVIRFRMLSDNIKEYFRSHHGEGLLEKDVERYERRLILKALENNDWNRYKTASEIGIPRTTLIGKMKRLNIVV